MLRASVQHILCFPLHIPRDEKASWFRAIVRSLKFSNARFTTFITNRYAEKSLKKH
jgi:hypothetical protein